MTLALTGLALIALIEAALWRFPALPLQKGVASLLIASSVVLCGVLCTVGLSVWSLLIAYFTLYRIVNLLRLVYRRLIPRHLYSVGRRTFYWLVACQIMVLLLAAAVEHFSPDTSVIYCGLAALILAASLLLLWSTRRNLRHAAMPDEIMPASDRDLPSLTVAIPARNETDDLTACLTSLLDTNYPKLEILVLDDCSQNKKTPEIIKSFAQSGVRFIAGKTVSPSWVAKNHAYDQLSDESSGEIILFCGVDTRFGRDTLGMLVRLMMQKNKTMISLLPANQATQSHGLWRYIYQPTRYAWELILPRRLLNRPPVLSTCWLIRRSALRDMGGFEAVRRKAVPESYFAKTTAHAADGYSFLIADDRLAISSHKALSEQRQTALRTRYPQLHRRPEIAAVLTLFELTLLLLPLIFVIAALAGQAWWLAALSAGSLAVCLYIYGRVANLTYRSSARVPYALMPVAAVHDITLLNYSMLRYEFGEVLWKGRNVCLPVMRMIGSTGTDMVI